VNHQPSAFTPALQEFPSVYSHSSRRDGERFLCAGEPSDGNGSGGAGGAGGASGADGAGGGRHSVWTIRKHSLCLFVAAFRGKTLWMSFLLQLRGTI